jgi:UDPglucose 6-dehydrogenase
MQLTFLGTGYVGLVTGAAMAELGHTVICADIDTKKIAKLKKGVMPIYEDGLEQLVTKNVTRGRLSFTSDVNEAIAHGEVVFSAVGTPEDPRTRRADLRFVLAAAESFARNLTEYKVFVNKSTVPVGTAEAVRAHIVKHAPKGACFEVVSNPEFLREGMAIRDFLEPDRIVVGVASEEAKAIMERVYAPLTKKGYPLLTMDIPSAELTKYAANAFLATKISFINQIAHFCEATGADVRAVAEGMGMDSRIGKRFLAAGAGYGGSCFPKDVAALIESAKEKKVKLSILQSVDSFNDTQKVYPVQLLKKQLKTGLSGKRIAILGLSFKPDTDDVREAPALYVVRDLLAAGATVVAYDPVANKEFAHAAHGAVVTYVRSAQAALRKADAVIIMTEWKEFTALTEKDFALMKKGAVVIDGRNSINKQLVESAGCSYKGIGI